jgi:Holliday junction DNA helicase RuvB
VANRLLRRVRDFATVEGNGKLTLPITKSALELAGIDERGLDEQDRQFLKTVIDVYDGGPVGIEAVAATMGEERDTLEDVIEPYLLQNAFVTRTRQGRRATKKAYEHLNLKWKPPQDPDGNGPTFFDADRFGGDERGNDDDDDRGDAKDDSKDDRKPKGPR